MLMGCVICWTDSGEVVVCHRHVSFALILLFVLVVSLVVGAGRAFAFGFAPRADFATSTYPISVATGDFNGDGNLDLAAACYLSSTVSVMLGDGFGGFGAKTDFATGNSPYCVNVGDFNSDGRPDLLAANYNAQTVSVLLGDGSGGFVAKTDFATGTSPVCVAVADFSGDGKQDLAVTNTTSSSISVLLGDGVGGFAAKTDFATGAAPYYVSVGDLNSDGKLDLVTANYSDSTASVLLGNGAGGFAAKTDFATGLLPYCVVVSDFNADGKLDVVTDNIFDGSVSVLLGNGAGGFAAKSDFATGASPYGMVTGDINGDGKLDLATASTSGSTVNVLLGNGSGGFGAKTDFACGGGPYGMAIGDFSGDGKPDLVTANTGTNTVSLLLSTPRGTMSIAAGSTYATDTAVTVNNAVYGVSEMRFRNETGSWSDWEAYSATRSWSLTPGDGTKTVQAQYRDLPSDFLALSDAIILDSLAPGGSFTIGGDSGYTNARAVTLHPVATDVHGPITLQVRNAGAAWPSAWQALAADIPFTLTFFEGEKIVEMRFRDAAGNLTYVTSAVIFDTTPPTGWITVADGVYATNTHGVTVESWAIDMSGPVVMRLRNGGEGWPVSWVSAGDSVPITLPSGEGTKIVQAQFKDLAGNIALVQDEVIVDTIDPVGSMSIAGGEPYATDADVVVALSASDATKVDAFRLRQDGGSWSGWQDMVEVQPVTLTGADGTRTLEVQYRDIAGNTSELASDAIVLDRVAPDHRRQRRLRCLARGSLRPGVDTLRRHFRHERRSG